MNLEDYAKLIKGKTCRWCKVELPTDIQFYTHNGGWKVEGHRCRLWLYVTCPGCEYQWSLGKLGVSRKVGE